MLWVGFDGWLVKFSWLGKLPDKEFRIMIVKLIQNLEIKMESQINSLETRIEKMQEVKQGPRINKKESIYNE